MFKSVEKYLNSVTHSTSPPLKGSKKEQLKCLSKIIIVIHPANTGNDINNKKLVKNILQENKGMNNALSITDRHEQFIKANKDVER